MVYGDEEYDLGQVIHLNALRRQKQFKQAQDTNAQWFVECRDMGDAYDRDAGIYFVTCVAIEEVDALVVSHAPDNPYERLLGIYHLALLLEAQGPGIARAQWLEHRDQINTADDITNLFLSNKSDSTDVDDHTNHDNTPPITELSAQPPLVIVMICLVVYGVFLLCFLTFC